MSSIRSVYVLLLLITTNGVLTFQHNLGPQIKIVGGDPADIEDYPYQVSLVYIDQHFCGGSLISPKHVLTAAHCTNGLNDVTELKIRAGSSFINEGGELRNVRKIYQHRSFNEDNYDYDITLLELEEAFKVGPAIQNIGLPAEDLNINDGTKANVTGWGRLSDHGPIPMQLQVVDVPILSEANCKIVYEERITERMICAGYPEGGKDACQGDSGGPLVVSGVLVGITSWGDGCGDANSPGIYTKVSQFIDFINSRMQLI